MAQRRKGTDTFGFDHICLENQPITALCIIDKKKAT